MEKIEQLFIRACKSLDARKRVLSVYRRFYLQCENPDPHLVIILAPIIDKHLQIPAADWINDLNPVNAWKFGGDETDDFMTITLNVMISRIRLAHRDKFPGLTPPAKFREKLKTVNYLVHYTSHKRQPVPCETVEQVWEAVGNRGLGEGYSVSSPTGLDVGDFIPY